MNIPLDLGNVPGAQPSTEVQRVAAGSASVGRTSLPDSSRSEESPEVSVVDAKQHPAAASSIEAQYASVEVLKVEDVVEILRMEERLVYAAIRRNELPGVKRFGKRGIIRISRRVFFDWLHGRGS
jgi:carbamoylphosphate synthase small subunit